MERRWGVRAETLPPDHPAWALEAHYIALGLVNLIVVLSPQRIILGGGVMQQPQVFPLLRTRVLELLNGYVQAPQILPGHRGVYRPARIGISCWRCRGISPGDASVIKSCYERADPWLSQHNVR